MECIFICKKCGNILRLSNDNEIIIPTNDKLKCSKCNASIGWDSSFPPLNVVDFIHSANMLFEQAKACDRQNLDKQYELINEFGKFNIDKTLLDKWNNVYERICENYPDNDDTVWIEITDTIENELNKEMNSDQAISIIAAIKTYSNNNIRKPYVVIVASLIEQLFNDYFKLVVSGKLTEEGQKIFLSNYEKTGIQRTIDIIDAFLDDRLYMKMEQYCKGFYNRWDNLRNIRNKIIHSNNVYITKIKVSQIKKLIDESLLVFSNLKSDFYKKNQLLYK